MKILLILLIALVVEACGVAILARGLRQIGTLESMAVADLARFAGRALTNPSIVGGTVLEACFFGTLLYLLSRFDVSIVWPFTSLGFVITTLAAKFLLHEHVSGLRWGGVGLIVAGAMLVVWSTRESDAVKRPVLEPAGAGLNADAPAGAPELVSGTPE